MDIIPDSDRKEVGLFLSGVLLIAATALGGGLGFVGSKALAEFPAISLDAELAVWLGFFISAGAGILVERTFRGLYRFIRGI